MSGARRGWSAASLEPHPPAHCSRLTLLMFSGALCASHCRAFPPHAITHQGPPPSGGILSDSEQAIRGHGQLLKKAAHRIPFPSPAATILAMWSGTTIYYCLCPHRVLKGMVEAHSERLGSSKLNMGCVLRAVNIENFEFLTLSPLCHTRSANCSEVTLRPRACRFRCIFSGKYNRHPHRTPLGYVG